MVAKEVLVGLEAQVHYEIISFLVIGFLLGVSFFYRAYKIQKDHGVLMDSGIAQTIMLILSIFQFYNLNHLDLHPFLWLGLLIIILASSLFFRLYFGGKSITIYDSTKESAHHIVQKVLTDLSISYKLNDGITSEETNIEIEDGMRITIDSGLMASNHQITFKKWWRSLRTEEIQYFVLEHSRKQRQGEVFWKLIITNVLLGIFIVGAVCFFYFDFVVPMIENWD